MSESHITLRATTAGNAGSYEGTSATSTPGITMPAAAERLWQLVLKMISFPVLMGVMLVGVSVFSLQSRLIDPDTWWHIAVGERILATHTFPTSDIYSFTAAGTHWIAYEWLGEVAMALAARAGGLVGIAALLFGIIAVTTILLYYYVFLRCRNVKAAAFATALLLPVAAPGFTIRPQGLGYIFLLLTLVCLEYFRRGRTTALWVLPPLFLIWVNTHGTFAFGLASIGLYWMSGLFSFSKGGLSAVRWSNTQRMQLEGTFLLCLLALLVTPYGSQLAAYPIEMATFQPFNIAHIQEWQPLSFSLGLGKYLLVLLLGVFLAHILLPMKYRLEEVGMLLFAVYSVCVHIRFISIFVMLFAPVVASILARWIPLYDRAKDKYLLNFAMIALALAGFIRFFPSKTVLQKLVAKDYPVQAVEYMRQHPLQGRMFNDYGFGGYLIRELGPDRKVFIDGRADIYEYSGVFQDYMKIVNLDPEALVLLRRYDVRSCLVGRKDPIATLLAASPDWKSAYSDDVSAIFVSTDHSRTTHATWTH